MVGQQPIGVDFDLVLLDITTNRRHLGDTFNRSQFIAQEPVLDGAQLLQIVLITFQNILIDPTDACSIGSKAGRHTLRQFAGSIIQIFEDARAGPVEIGAVFKR